MRTDYTIKELFENSLNGQDIDVITVHYPFGKVQYDNYESLPFKAVVVDDYEVEYDADEGMIYLDIFCMV
jgi:hypothetical protein